MANRKTKLNKDEQEEFDTWSQERSQLSLNSNMVGNKIEIKCKSKAQKDALLAIENGIAFV